ncbi:acyl-CoA dehydrogenase family protein [Ramlibacter sp. USB13]|uniref:Acyl-CoA dehydrogenase family protein n=1 Tax=Ramlibacter cellulosilyticus TaxID=2764187 RepID=A0A923SD67_9BURK|nr:acyl-CoA dehydrogenase family protein [Ramlibacter cellulosilyticus]MBC5785680.1 acyl-CoA dehydrogenase family protein [Ramlibacter cellulosilyticus]
MNDYRPPVDEQRFLLLDVLRTGEILPTLPAFTEADADLLTQVLEEAGKFVGKVVSPLQAVGDAPGCRFEDGRVTTPPGFADAYRAFWQAGWPSLACAPEDGGQGLPWVLEGVLYEMLSAANHGWTMAPGLLHGAYECLKHHGSEELKARYLPKVASGEWLATMCLTEPHAGSDLGLARTQAVPQADGSFRLRGTKIFISGGEHDLTDNIVHLVLAREPGAPAGPKGLSLFLAPKFLEDGTRNPIACERIEEKMGLHGSPTCVLRFDEAVAWRVGEPGRGLNAMFVMMNAARLHVALQGIGLLDAAWQKANAYAQERRQMRAPGALRGTGAADPIVRHPAVRRILDTERAWADGLRVLAYRTGIELDLARHHPDAQRRATAQQWCSLVTPVLKAVCTEQGFAGASRCLQVFGGHGYVKEWGIEQIVRDARVTMIYEGTNEIQAIDLLARKVLPDGGQGLLAVLDTLARDLDAQRDAALLARFDALRAITRELAAASAHDDTLPYEAADDYLRAVGLALLGWAWSAIERTPGAETARWTAPARAAQLRVLPEFELRLDILRTQCATTTPRRSAA